MRSGEVRTATWGAGSGAGSRPDLVLGGCCRYDVGGRTADSVARAFNTSPQVKLSHPQAVLALATIAVLLVVPDWPHRHLDDPSYWGLIGYLVVFLAVFARGSASWSARSANRRMIRLFLVGLPAIYVANRLRFGGSAAELAVQGAGLLLWLTFAVRASRSDLVLWFGCTAHAVWDAAHFGRVDFVPVWYVSLCLAADIGLGAFVLLCLRDAGTRGDAPASSASTL